MVGSAVNDLLINARCLTMRRITHSAYSRGALKNCALAAYNKMRRKKGSA
jgi:hypothetical protein